MTPAAAFGIRANLGQVLHQLLQVLLVGMTIGMMRNVVPALAETEVGVPRGARSCCWWPSSSPSAS